VEVRYPHPYMDDRGVVMFNRATRILSEICGGVGRVGEVNNGGITPIDPTYPSPTHLPHLTAIFGLIRQRGKCEMVATHPYWRMVEACLFKRAEPLRARARAHGLTLRTEGKDTEPKYFSLWRKAAPDEYVDVDEMSRRRKGANGRRVPVMRSSANSITEVEQYLDRLDRCR
jgi:hypothetical protein